jgi:arginyl-tRNA synthetase
LYSDKKQVLSGKISILRFFSYLNSPNFGLATGLDIQNSVDLLRLAKTNTADVINGLKFKGKFLAGDFVSMCDLLAWDQCLKYKSEDVELFKRVNSLPEVMDATKAVNQTLKSVPVLDYYKYSVIEQVSEALNISPSVVIEAMLVPKSKEQGNLAIPVPALKLPGNPAEIAKKIVDAVHYLLYRSNLVNI